jgi:hypothetical protein
VTDLIASFRKGAITPEQFIQQAGAAGKGLATVSLAARYTEQDNHIPLEVGGSRGFESVLAVPDNCAIGIAIAGEELANRLGFPVIGSVTIRDANQGLVPRRMVSVVVRCGPLRETHEAAVFPAAAMQKSFCGADFVADKGLQNWLIDKGAMEIRDGRLQVKKSYLGRNSDAD